MSRGVSRRFHGTATCGSKHQWPCSWTFEPFQTFTHGRLHNESRQVIVPAECPTCDGKALSLAPATKKRSHE